MQTVAIVGRPNVGKSTLFNRISRRRRALVGNESGITRDRLFQVIEWEGRRFEVIDTGGIVPDDRQPISEKVFEQARLAIDEAALILLVVDGRAGVTPLDREVSDLLRSRGKTSFLAVNKIDVPAHEDQVYEFYELGFDRLFPISAEHGHGVGELLDAVVNLLPAEDSGPESEGIPVAIIGRPNVGKSSLVNRILGRKRVIVSDIPGTTRDSIDATFDYCGTKLSLIDTAGIRRKGKTEMVAEKLSVVMARKHLERADVALLLIDASEGATKLDATIAGYAQEAGASVIIVVNKWDLVEKDTHTAHELEEQFRLRMKFLEYAPLIFVSALTGQRVRKILDLVLEAHQQRYRRVATSDLNSFVQRRVAGGLGIGGRNPLKFICQTGVAPPAFVLFTRGSKRLHFSKVRFLQNQLREHYGFMGTPLRIIQRTAKRKQRKRG